MANHARHLGSAVDVLGLVQVANAGARMMKNALVVIAKRPLPGQTKTHLTPPLLPVQAAELYECFLRDTLDVARQVPDMTRLIAYAPLDAKKLFRATCARLCAHSPNRR